MSTLLLAVTHVSDTDYVTFWVATAAIVLGALGVVGSRHPVHAALSLVLTLFGVAVLFVEQDADFLAAVQVIVYAGAIVVLFLFVIMFLGVDRMEDLSAEPLRGQRIVAVVLGILAAGTVLTFGARSHWAVGAQSVAGPASVPGSSGVALLGKSVFTTYLFAFEATAGLLVIAVVGAVLLSRRRGPETLEEPSEAGEASEASEPSGAPLPEAGTGGEPEPDRQIEEVAG